VTTATQPEQANLLLETLLDKTLEGVTPTEQVNPLFEQLGLDFEQWYDRGVVQARVALQKALDFQDPLSPTVALFLHGVLLGACSTSQES
jgi:hypothetical protein